MVEEFDEIYVFVFSRVRPLRGNVQIGRRRVGHGRRQHGHHQRGQRRARRDRRVQHQLRAAGVLAQVN